MFVQRFGAGTAADIGVALLPVARIGRDASCCKCRLGLGTRVGLARGMWHTIAITGLLLAGCGSRTDVASDFGIQSDKLRDTEPIVTDAELRELIAGNSELAANLYRIAAATPGNKLMSPHSISTALAMTWAGARGQTALQMAAALKLTLPAETLHAAFNKLDLDLASRAALGTSDTVPFRLTTANSIWGQEGRHYESAFLDTLAINYGAGLNVQDFERDPEAARHVINEWVEGHTDDQIQEMLTEGAIKTNTRLALTNAIYFSGAWAKPFRVEQTAARPFFVDGQEVSVPSMKQKERIQYTERDGYRAVALPYDGRTAYGEDVSDLTMVLVEPDDLPAFEASLSGQRLQDIATTLEAYEVDLTLPKFTFDAPLDLEPLLRTLGMLDAFDETTADFSGIDGGAERLVISHVVHKGFIGIDEHGTVAAAAAGVVVGPVDQPPSASFVIDRPFVFFIRDRKTGAILFLGRVVDPR